MTKPPPLGATAASASHLRPCTSGPVALVGTRTDAFNPTESSENS